MVNTHQSNPEFFVPAFDEAVQRAVNYLLPGLTAQITNELCQNGAGSNGDQPPTIHIWRNYLKCWDVLMSLRLGWLAISLRVMLLISGNLSSKPREVKRMWRYCHGRTSVRLFFAILPKVDVAQVANAGRNIELLHKRGGVNNKRNHDGDCIQSANKNNNQRGYAQRGNDGRNYDRQDGNISQRFYQQNQDQQYNRSSGSLRQKKYTDYTSPPPCDT
nr:zinc finger, CCHC-type, retrotransposon Gag domain protein [Tanacetum cinerariifolium]